MQHVNRVAEKSTTSGTGSYTLSGSLNGYQAFSDGMSVGDYCYYCCENGTSWEVGYGQLVDSTTLSRITLIDSSTGSFIDWDSSTKNIFNTGPATKVIVADNNDNVTLLGHLYTQTDSTYDIGSSSVRWANIYADNIDATTITGTVTPGGFTQGSVVFAGSGGTLTQDNSNLFWDDTTNRLGIGTNSPSYDLHVSGDSYFTTSIGIGINPNNNIGVYSYISKTDSSGINAIRGEVNHTSNTTGTYYNYASWYTAEDIVASGITNNGYIIGMLFDSSFQGAGTINEVYGCRMTAGTGVSGTGTINTTYALYARVLNQGSGTMTNAYGIYIQTNDYSGTIDYAYGLYLTQMHGSTSSYGIYQSSALDKNYLAGKLSIGTTSDIEELNVAGRISILGTGNSIFIGDSAGINDDFSGRNNIGIGYQALTTETSSPNNVAIGYQAGTSVTTGSNGTYIGHIAGSSITTGSNNTAIGYASLISVTTQVENTAIGSLSGYNSTTSHSTMIGYASGRLNTGTYTMFIGNNCGYNNTGAHVVGIGYVAGYNNTGSYGVFIGNYSGYSNTADYNVSIGYNALYKNTSGRFQTAIGSYSLYNHNTGDYNVGVGHYSLYTITTEVGNTAVGPRSGYQSTGHYNTFIGYRSGYNNSGTSNIYVGYDSGYNNSGSYCCAIGYQSIYNNSGNHNIGIGYLSGRYITGGSTENTTSDKSIYIGYNTKAKANGDTNEIVIGYDTTGNGSNTVTLGNSSITDIYCNGKIHGSKLEVFSSSDSGAVVFIDSNGDLNVDSVNFYWDDTSDRLGIDTNVPTEALDINSDAIRVRTAQTPASSTASGNTGTICWDSTYLYICVNTNTWHRVEHKTW